MKKNTINNSIKWALVATTLCVGYLILSTFYNMRKTHEETGIIQTSLNRLLQLENIIKNARAIESGQRGYIISGDDVFLKTYTKGMDRIANDTMILKTLPVKNEKEKGIQQRLLREINAKLEHSKKSVEEYKLN